MHTSRTLAGDLWYSGKAEFEYSSFHFSLTHHVFPLSFSFTNNHNIFGIKRFKSSYIQEYSRNLSRLTYKAHRVWTPKQNRSWCHCCWRDKIESSNSSQWSACDTDSGFSNQHRTEGAITLRQCGASLQRIRFSKLIRYFFSTAFEYTLSNPILRIANKIFFSNFAYCKYS